MQAESVGDWLALWVYYIFMLVTFFVLFYTGYSFLFPPLPKAPTGLGLLMDDRSE